MFVCLPILHHHYQQQLEGKFHLPTEGGENVNPPPSASYVGALYKYAIRTLSYKDKSYAKGTNYCPIYQI